MIDIDIRLLTVFARPTVGIAPGKPKKRFGDPLFVRTSTGMAPASLAQALEGTGNHRGPRNRWLRATAAELFARR